MASRLFVTWGCNMFQEFGCSPIKTIHVLDSERHETVLSISDMGVRALREQAKKKHCTKQNLKNSNSLISSIMNVQRK